MNDYSSIFVILMGLGTVFFGLVCLIALTSFMGRALQGWGTAPGAAAVATALESAGPAPVPVGTEPNRQEMVAAVSAAIAEELGVDITGLRILSIHRL